MAPLPIDPDTVRYTLEHVWLRPWGLGWRIGISQYAARAFDRIEFVDLPNLGQSLIEGRTFVSVEGNGRVIDFPAPFTARVTKLNPMVIGHPELIRESLDRAWLVAASPGVLAGWYLTPEEYEIGLPVHGADRLARR